MIYYIVLTYVGVAGFLWVSRAGKAQKETFGTVAVFWPFFAPLAGLVAPFFYLYGLFKGGHQAGIKRLGGFFE